MATNQNCQIDYTEAERLLGNDARADRPCPACGPSRSSPRSQMRRVLRLWRMGERAVKYKCIRCGISDVASLERSTPPSPQERAEMKRRDAARTKADEAERERKRQYARKIWAESIDSPRTWAEDYLAGRGLALPDDAYIRRRTLRFHPHCPFPDDTHGPALLAAFTPILTHIPDDPFFDPPLAAIHRIRGRGHENKFMLAPTGGAAVQLGEWERIGPAGVLHVCEGIETGVKIFERHRPVWALGSAGAMEKLPVVDYVRRLVIWADNDASGTGIEAAKTLAAKYCQAEKAATIWMPSQAGGDYAEA